VGYVAATDLKQRLGSNGPDNFIVDAYEIGRQSRKPSIKKDIRHSPGFYAAETLCTPLG
jgi:hypothetical protein